MNCNTPISTLTHNQIKHITKLAHQWCMTNMGKHKVKGYPEIKVSQKKFKDDPYYGFYLDDYHTITMFPNTFADRNECIRKYIAMVLHEYYHAIQNSSFEKYMSQQRKYGYWNHPEEVRARAQEKLWNLCYKDIKDKFKH